jgi:hypothetical protein
MDQLRHDGAVEAASPDGTSLMKPSDEDHVLWLRQWRTGGRETCERVRGFCGVSISTPASGRSPSSPALPAMLNGARCQ